MNLGCKLDLKRIALQARNAEYNPKRFAAVIMRIRAPRTTALIFSSGKMVCTGAKSEEDSIQAARRYARVIQKLGFPVKFNSPPSSWSPCCIFRRNFLILKFKTWSVVLTWILKFNSKHSLWNMRLIAGKNSRIFLLLFSIFDWIEVMNPNYFPV